MRNFNQYIHRHIIHTHTSKILHQEHAHIHCDLEIEIPTSVFAVVILTFLVSCVLPVSDGELEPHVPDHVVAETGPNSHPVLIGIHRHGENQPWCVGVCVCVRVNEEKCVCIFLYRSFTYSIYLYVCVCVNA